MKLRYETYIDKITESLDKYKRSIDSMAKNYIAEVGRVKETALSHKDFIRCVMRSGSGLHTAPRGLM